ncbi:MAG TPA: methyltransferase domain-containing protein, partial [Anaerolineales bacterium]|nr:methyltransferase domain-containing protein [Anaerolineales bacterium]
WLKATSVATTRKRTIMTCNCCEITDHAFTEAEARVEVKNYRKRGPARQTKLILEAIRSLGLKDAALLDVGGGIGAIHHELLEDVAREATHVDASSAYLKVATEEAKRRGHNERVKFIHADFTDIAADLPQADVVTLDRVVCCYPDFRGLLRAATSHSRRAIALTYPRETWYMRFGLRVINFFQRLRRDPFRVFLHPVAEMESLLKDEGLRKVSVRRLFVWEMALYQRAN